MTRTLLVACVAMALSACAVHVPPRPTGEVTPDPTAMDTFTAAIVGCRGLRSLTAELSLSGRAGGDRIHGRVVAGLESGGALRLEGLAPFGAPLFVLAGRDEMATLLLPRDHRVLADTRIAVVLGRLTGLALGADDLRLILSGCLAVTPTPSLGRRWRGGWQAVTLESDRVAYLRTHAGHAVVAAADYGPWRVDYADHLNGWPRTVRVRRADGTATDVTARVTQLEINVPIDPKAFAIDVPPGTTPMTIDELRPVTP